MQQPIRLRLPAVLAAAGLAAGGLMAASSSADGPGAPPVRLAQGPRFSQFPGGGNQFPGGGGQFPGGGGQFPGGGGFPGGPGGGFPGGPGGGFPGGGRQGAAFGGGGMLSLAPGEMTRVAAFCTDLLSDPPDQTTRFTGGDGARVAAATGEVMELDAAIRAGAVAIRGRSDSFDPLRRDGSLALDLYVANLSRVPVRVSIPAGTRITPAGQAEQPLPKEADRLFALAGKKGLAQRNTLQFAIWAARGSTAEEVEQAEMLRLPAAEVSRVQALLDESGISRRFDRERGAYEARYGEAAEKLGETAKPVTGTALLATGEKARAEGRRGPDGRGVVLLRPLKREGAFYCRAEFTPLPDGRIKARLFHLVTGRPIRGGRGSLLIYPSA